MARKSSKEDKFKKDIEKQKKVLLERRESLISRLAYLSSEGKKTERKGDSSDLAASSRDEELNLILSDHERQELRSIDEALMLIEEGNYGLCEECGGRISFKRLEALPFAKYCVDCKAERENRDKLAKAASSERMVNLFSDTIKLADLASEDEEENIVPNVKELDDDIGTLEFEGKDLEDLDEGEEIKD